MTGVLWARLRWSTCMRSRDHRNWASVHTGGNMHAHAHTLSLSHTHIYTQTHTHTHTHAHTHAHTDTQTCSHTNTQTHRHAHTHTHTHTIQIKLGWALFVTYTIIQSIMRSEMCSLHLTENSLFSSGVFSSLCHSLLLLLLSLKHSLWVSLVFPWKQPPSYSSPL